MSSIRPRVRIPQTASPDEVIRIRTLMTHPMETGNRPGPDGAMLPRNVIERFTCHFEDELVFELEVAGGMAANPFIEFQARVPHSGSFRFVWTEDTGETWVETARVEVA